MQGTQAMPARGQEFLLDALNNDDLIEALLATGTDHNPEEVEKLFDNALS